MITNQEKKEVKEFLEKYEKYHNFQDSENFEETLSSISSIICKKVAIEIEKCDEVEDYIRELYNLSDGEGLSFILSPGPTFQYTQADQVQRLIP
jgi:hypothetical protein